MLRRLLPCLLLACPLVCPAQTEDEKAVLATIDRFFAAMTARDTAAMSATLLRGGSLHVASLRGNEAARTSSFQGYLDRLAKGKERLLERYWDADVELFGESMAVADMAYDFHVDGRFSHCGTDLFTLVKGPDGWRIASVAFTRKEDGCRESPPPPVDR